MTPPADLHKQLSSLMTMIEEELKVGKNDGTLLPGRYDNAAGMLETAKNALMAGDIQTALDMVGEINVDALKMVDELDDTLGDLAQKLKRIKSHYASLQQHFPDEIVESLHELRIVVEKYAERIVE